MASTARAVGIRLVGGSPAVEIRLVGGSPAIGIRLVGGSGARRRTGRGSSTGARRRWRAGRSSGCPAAAGAGDGTAGSRCLPAPPAGGRRGAGTTGTRVVLPPSAEASAGRGCGMTATRCVNASVAGSSISRSPWVVAPGGRERPFVCVAAPEVRAFSAMHSPSPTTEVSFRSSRRYTLPCAPTIAPTPTSACLFKVPWCFTDRRESLGRTIATAMSCVNNGCVL